MALNKLKPIFYQNLQSWKDISKDSSGEVDAFMVDSKKSTVNFDLVKRQYTSGLGCSEDNACSVDALGYIKDTVYFVEFKNGEVHRTVQDKVRDSLLIYCDIEDVNLNYTRENVEMVLVYNHEKNKDKINSSGSKNKIAKHFLEKAGEELVYFNLDRFEKIYFRKVHTYTPQEFALLLEEMEDITDIKES